MLRLFRPDVRRRCRPQLPYCGTWAATYSSAVGPCQAPACTLPKTVASSSAVSVYSVFREFHAPPPASTDPGPGPLLSNAECTSGGAAGQIGAVIALLPQPC